MDKSDSVFAVNCLGEPDTCNLLVLTNVCLMPFSLCTSSDFFINSFSLYFVSFFVSFIVHSSFSLAPSHSLSRSLSFHFTCFYFYCVYIIYASYI